MNLRSCFLFCASIGVVLFCAHASVAGEIVMDAQHAYPNATESAGHTEVDPHQTVVPASPVVPVLEGYVDDSLFPQHGDDGLLDGKARDMRSRAKEQQSNEAVLPMNDMQGEGDISPDMAARASAAGNVSKARAYMKNSNSNRVAELPVVSCENVNNVSGRIGDDSQSGSLITIMLKGKPVKARCK